MTQSRENSPDNTTGLACRVMQDAAVTGGDAGHDDQPTGPDASPDNGNKALPEQDGASTAGGPDAGQDKNAPDNGDQALTEQDGVSTAGGPDAGLENALDNGDKPLTEQDALMACGRKRQFTDIVAETLTGEDEERRGVKSSEMDLQDEWEILPEDRKILTICNNWPTWLKAAVEFLQSVGEENIWVLAVIQYIRLEDMLGYPTAGGIVRMFRKSLYLWLMQVHRGLIAQAGQMLLLSG
jgi:hypothetical protein